MTGIDISSNSLTGSIPFTMGDLKELRALNLSNNLLTGPLPTSFGNLKNLESLDLSHNKLNGTIPPEFVRMTSLSTFSVAFNNLSGTIPYDQQLRTFNQSSFMGNPCLCGEQLKRICPSNNQIPCHNEEEEKEEASRLIGKPFYISLGVSYILGFCGVIAFLMFNNTWRQRYFQVIDWQQFFFVCFEKPLMFWCCSGK